MGNSASGSFVPIPVSVTRPNIIPTHDAAVIKDVPLLAVFIHASNRSLKLRRVCRLKQLTTSVKIKLKLTARKGVNLSSKNRIRLEKANKNSNPWTR